MIAMLVAQPLVGHRSRAAGAFFDAVFAGICVYVFVAVFARPWQRRVSLALLGPAILANVAHYVLAPAEYVRAAVVFHGAIVLFLAFAVAVILGRLSRKRVIEGDDVVGAVCGYLLGALAWSNLYTLGYLLVPEAFNVNRAIAWRLADWHSRRALFDYLSLTTLTGLGYADIAPGGPPAQTLSWMEVIFGQFYMAVVVAQLVGLKLAGAMKGGDAGST